MRISHKDNAIFVKLETDDLTELNISKDEVLTDERIKDVLAKSIATSFLKWNEEKYEKASVFFSASTYETEEIIIEFIDLEKIRKHYDYVIFEISNLNSFFQDIKQLNTNFLASCFGNSKKHFLLINKTNNTLINILKEEFLYTQKYYSIEFMKEHYKLYFENKNILELAKDLY